MHDSEETGFSIAHKYIYKNNTFFFFISYRHKTIIAQQLQLVYNTVDKIT